MGGGGITLRLHPLYSTEVTQAQVPLYSLPGSSGSALWPPLSYSSLTSWLLSRYLLTTPVLLSPYSRVTQTVLGGGCTLPPPNPGLLVVVVTLSLLSLYIEVHWYY